MKIKNIIELIICIAIPLLVGGIAGYATSSSMNSWYSNLNKPFFNPPSWVFGPVWTILYLLMGISLYLIWKQPASTKRSKSLQIFFLQLLLNFAWSFIFFKFEQTGLALLEIIVLWLAILTMLFFFYKLNRIAAYLQFPYLAWVSFATVLTASIWHLNR